MDRYLNIVALNVPYPADYGGIIDIYYKLKGLRALGVKVILHCFLYERQPAPKLEELCEEVHYYKRRTGLLANLTFLPYNVYGRKHPQLIQNLLANDYPILFEGLHSCYYLPDARLKDRLKICRESNIEHDYYRLIAKACKGVVAKTFHYIEAWRFKRYEAALADADILLGISLTDTEYLRKRFPGKRVEFIPAFHANERITAQPGQSDFILYHAKLSVFENEEVALFLIKEVFSKLTYPCVLAGMNPSKRIWKAIESYPHITLEANPSAERMDYLIREAQIHLLITFQPTGLKLKLLNSLFAGRHIVVNSLMLTGSGLDPLCHIANTPQEMIATCNQLINGPFTEEDIRIREDFLIPAYSTLHQTKRLYHIIYDNK
ncbi:hypothetical protein AGMMS49574_13160 [Bacteroidia bacterium]|nr:hypothetical protein AGMMS49574_13160 [Bacteroidia bacterium]